MGDVVAPTVPVVRLGVGRSLATIGGVQLDAGLTLDLTPMDYQGTMGDGTAWFATILASVDVHRELSTSTHVHGQVAVGSTRVSDLHAGNPFSAGGNEIGVVYLPSARVGLGLSYRLDEQLSIHGSPCVTYSWRSEELADDIDSVIRFAAVAGVTYGW